MTPRGVENHPIRSVENLVGARNYSRRGKRVKIQGKAKRRGESFFGLVGNEA